MFKIKTSKAIKLLQQQIDKLYDEEFVPDQVWITHTQSYIKRYFGGDSPEFKYINEFRFRDDSTTELGLQLNIAKVKRHLEECIYTIRQTGLNTPNWFLRLKSDWQIGLISLLVTLAIPGFIAVGIAISNYQNVSLNQKVERLEDSISKYKNAAMDTSTKYRSIIKDLNQKLTIATAPKRQARDTTNDK